jgi:hypothetical protein
MGAAASIVVERGLKIGGPSPGREKQYRKTLVTNSDQKTAEWRRLPTSLSISALLQRVE